MSSRARTHGLTAEINKKTDACYDSEAEVKAMQWIGAVIGDSSLESCVGRDQVNAKLKTGVILCKLMNKLQPDAIKKIHPEESNSFKHMENVGNFLKAAENYGCNRGDLFQTVYLTDNQNMGAVIGAIFAVGRKAQNSGWKGAQLGPKEATANPREFTEEQMLHGRVHGI